MPGFMPGIHVFSQGEDVDGRDEPGHDESIAMTGRRNTLISAKAGARPHGDPSMPNMPIDLSTVDWLYVAVLAVFVLVATFIANLITFNRRGMAAILSALIFAALFVAWTYYPHGLPLPTRLTPAP
jgi:hypothetical protein